jgi:hypothetical protein
MAPPRTRRVTEHTAAADPMPAETVTAVLHRSQETRAELIRDVPTPLTLEWVRAVAQTYDSSEWPGRAVIDAYDGNGTYRIHFEGDA